MIHNKKLNLTQLIMSDREITEGNRLIAHFMMDAKCLPVGVHNVEDLKYNTSWNELMPVVTKIKKLKYPVYMYQSHIQNSVEIFKLREDGKDSKIVRESSTTKEPIRLLWEAVVGFMEYYNRQNNEK